MKETLLDYINYYTNYCLIIKNLSVTTVNSYLTSIKEFFEYVNKNIFKNKYVRYLEMKINDVNELKEKDFYNYICYLIVKNNSVITRKRKTQCIKLFFDYLCYVKHIISFNPVMNIEKEKSRLKIVSKSLSKNDFIKLFNYTCNDEKNKDIRNKTIISLFINCGLRNSELRNLKLNDFDFTDNKFFVLGKGKKERVCYLNSWVYKNLKTYLNYRKHLLNGRTNDLLFFNNNYKRISSNTLLHIIKNVYKETGIDYKKYDVHSLRHTFATNLYNSNIPINVIQELLGHSCVESTQFYIHINDDKMKKIMNSHPLANITNISTMKIKEKGLIFRIGANKNGYWNLRDKLREKM